MKNASLLCIFISCMYLTGFSQAKSTEYNAGTAAATLKDQVAKMGQALLNKDYKTFCHYTYPKLVKMMGGEEKMIQTLSQSMDAIKAQGVEMLGITYGEPGKAYKEGTVWQSTIVQHTTMKIPNNKIMATSTLVAFSSDNGKNWTFMDTNNKDDASIRQAIPELSHSISIPPPQKPVPVAQ